MNYIIVYIMRAPKFNRINVFQCSGLNLCIFQHYEEAMEAFEYAGLLEPHFKLTFCDAAEVALAIGDPKRALKSLYDKCVQGQLVHVERAPPLPDDIDHALLMSRTHTRPSDGCVPYSPSACW